MLLPSPEQARDHRKARVTSAIYLTAVVVFGFTATLLRLPPLVGFLAAGFALSAAPVAHLPYVEILGDLGVAVLLFTIGLKLNPRILIRKEVYGTAIATTALLTALGSVLLAGLLLLGLQVDSTTPNGVLVLGFALSFSSTVVVVKLLEERDDANSLYGRIAIGVLVAQDIGAVLYMSASSQRTPSPWALALVLLWPASRLARGLLNRIDHREMRSLFGISMALLPGFLLFEIVGIDGDLGALVMGALFASHPAAKELSSALFTIRACCESWGWLRRGVMGGGEASGVSRVVSSHHVIKPEASDGECRCLCPP